MASVSAWPGLITGVLMNETVVGTNTFNSKLLSNCLFCVANKYSQGVVFKKSHGDILY